MKFKKITYLITQEMNGLKIAPIRVTGYATDFYPVRLCIRKVSKNFWRADHYDTGTAIILYSYNNTTREDAYVAAVSKLYKGLVSGDYQRALEKYESSL